MAKKTVISKGIAFGSLYKIFFLGLLLSVGICMIVVGGFALFGFHVFFWDNKPITGIDGFLAAVAMAPIFAASYGLFMSLLVSFGLWVYTRVFSLRVTLKLRSSFSDEE